MKQVAVTVVFGTHAGRLDETFSSFSRNPFLQLHAFVLGGSLPSRRVDGVTYHLRPPDPAFSHPIRDADYRRWQLIDELDADYALVVDGCDALCLQRFPEIPELLRGAWLAAVPEHAASRYLAGGVYTGSFLNAGVTFWDVRASKPLRDEVVARGRIRFRNYVDDQLALNEVVYARYLERLTLLPCVYNYRAYYRRRVRGWPTTDSFDGVRIYHHDEWRKALGCLPIAAEPRLEALVPDTGPLPPWRQFWRRLAERMRRQVAR